MIAVRITNKSNQSIKLLICCVYLPSTNNSLAEFKKALEEIELFCFTRKSMGDTFIVVLGGFNAHMEDERSGKK